MEALEAAHDQHTARIVLLLARLPCKVDADTIATLTPASIAAARRKSEAA